MEHSRAAEPIGVPVRTPQQDLKHSRREEEQEPTCSDLSTDAGRDYPSAIDVGEARLSRRGGGV
ncbi:hypothetical protein [Streptomyces sp. NPDC091371]|uniref:hypothetical protein n=1 Tax=Streptomyces sp. NPDC091371 TaxID=3155303 RepID=UPI0034133A3C